MGTSERRTNVALWVVTAVLTLATWAYVAAWTVPRAISPGIADYWFFTGVAERLRAGEHLYTDVWDNKDPLVFHSLAWARTWGAGGAWALEFLWVVVISVALYSLARRSDVGRAGSILVGFVAGPFITLGYFYFMGTTHLPGISLTLATIALAAHNRAVLAGVIVAILLFFKLIMLPAAVIAVVVLLATDRRRLWSRAALGFAAAFVVLATWLSLRGEFFGFLAAQLDNAAYSQAPIVSADQSSVVRLILQHVAVLVNPHAAVVGVATIVGLVALWRPARTDNWLRRLWLVTAAVFLVNGMVLAVTGKWLPHAEILAVSSTLLVVLAAATLVARQSRWWQWLLVVVLTVVLSGLSVPSTYRYVFTSAVDEWSASNRVDEITAALRELPPQTFAIVGLSVPRSAGLEDWTLSCRYYGQRPFHPQSVFDEMMDCLPTTGVVVLTYDAAQVADPAFPAYSQFLTDVETLMARDFTCTAQGANRICQRTATS